MRRVLVIDDDRMLRREVNRALTKEFEVLEAAEPSEGLRKAKIEKLDLILLDVLMPEMDGISVLRQLRDDRVTNGIPVIMVTSLGSDEQVAACLEEGAVDHITKPFSHRMLCARVSSALMKYSFGGGDDERNGFAPHSGTSPTGVVAFLGAKGGVGTTTLVANASAVAAMNNQSSILCELRSTFGSLSLQLNSRPREHLGTLPQAAEGLSNIKWDDFLVRDSSGLRILFGPQTRDFPLDASLAEGLIGALRPLANMVFLDLAAGLTDLNREILKHCDHVVLVLDCEPTSIAAATLIMDQLQQSSIRHSIKAVVVKRTELYMPPKIGDVRSALGCDIIGIVPPGADVISLAVRTGATLVTLQPDDAVASTIRGLTEEHLLVETQAVAAAR